MIFSGRRIFHALAAVVLYAVAGCVLDGPVAKRGSEVENEVYGTLVSQSGEPVVGARVKAVPSVDPAPAAKASDTDSVWTDTAGRYSFLGLPAGRYDLYGDYESGSLVVLIPGVEHADTLGRDSVGVDTLRAPGRIRGRLMLGSRGQGGVLAYIPGTSYLSVSDDSGKFTLPGIPQGRYSIKYSIAGFLVAPDTGIFVASGSTVDLPTKQLAPDPALPPPAPEGLKAEFDTLLGRANLSWTRVDVSDLAGYLVYRDVQGFPEPQVVPGGYTGDTVFVDSTLGDPALLPPVPLIYRVKARDVAANTSLFSAAASVRPSPRAAVTTVITWTDPAQANDTVALGDTVPLAVEYSNPTRKNRRISWRQAGVEAPLADKEIAALAGKDTLPWRAGKLGEWTLAVTVTDETGREWSRSRTLKVFGNDLRSIAAGDTTVSPGDSFDLRASAQGRFGRIVGWAWEIGSGAGFAPAGPGTRRFKAPAQAGMLPCVLEVSDAFGNKAYDTAMVRIDADPPSVRARGDTTVSLGDTVKVAGSALDGFGRIMRWEWKSGLDGQYAASDSVARIRVPSRPDSAHPIILRVTDDDGQTSSDTVHVRILADLPSLSVTGDTTVSLGDTVLLKGDARDGFGGIVKWEWKSGPDGEFRENSASVRLAMPRHADPSYPVIARVTDDDGQIALDTARVAIVADHPSALAEGGDTVSIGDSLVMRGEGRDGYGAVVRHEWACGRSGSFVKAEPGRHAVQPPSVPEADYPCVLRVTDDDGLTGFDTVRFVILQDLPVAKVSAEPAEGFAGEAVRLHSTGSADRFGRIVRWDWDIGGTGLFQGAGPDTAFVLPAKQGMPYPCILRVTDDDGQTALDTVHIKIHPGRRVDAGKDTTVTVGNLVRLHGTAPPETGVVERWEWDIGATGVFRRTSTPDTSFLVDFSTKSRKCVLRGTGETGIVSLDTMSVTVIPPGTLSWDELKIRREVAHMSGAQPVEFQGKAWIVGCNFSKEVWSAEDGVSWNPANLGAAIPAMASSALAVHNGRLWMLGGSEIGGHTGTNRVFSSPDGVNWAETAVRTPFPKRSSHTAASFNGNLCVMGGFDQDGTSSVFERRDMWCSPDGADWKQVGGTFPTSGYAPNAGVRPDGTLVIFDYGSILETKDGIQWTSVPATFDVPLWRLRGFVFAGDEIWLLGLKEDRVSRGLWRFRADGKGTLDPGMVGGKSEFYDWMFSFQGLPLIYSPWLALPEDVFGLMLRLER